MAEPQRRDWLKWALGGSLALNLLVLGLVAGAVLRGPPERATILPGLWHYGRALPESHRRELGRALREQRGDWGEMREAWRSHRAAVADALTAEPFEIARVETLLAEDRRMAGELSDRVAGLLVAEIARMSPAERATYAAALLQPPRRSRDRER